MDAVLPQEFVFTHGRDYPPEHIAADAYSLIQALLLNKRYIGLTKSDIKDLNAALATLGNIKGDIE